MNHDYAHCWDYEKGVCPEECFRAKLTLDDLKKPYPITYSKFKGTEACPRTNPKLKHTRADRIRALTDEELAAWIAGEILHLTGGSLDMAREAWLRWLREEMSKEEEA